MNISVSPNPPLTLLSPPPSWILTRSIGNRLFLTKRELKLNSDMVSHLMAWQNLSDAEKLSEQSLRLAMLPESSILNFPPADIKNGSNPWPILQCGNVYILPGVSEIFQQKMKLLAKHFLRPQASNSRHSIVVSIEEASLVPTIDSLVQEFGEKVKIGSYPCSGESVQTLITLESSDPRDVKACLSVLTARVPDGSIDRPTDSSETLKKM